INLIIALGLSSCAISYLPVESKVVSVNEDFAIINNQQFSLAVKATYWSKEPDLLANYYSVFYISIKNLSDKKFNIDSNQFSLLDENRNQLDVILKENMIEMLEYEMDDFNDMFIPPEERKTNLEKRLSGRRNIDKFVFNFGDIMPNATKSGYLLFQELDSKNEKCSFIYKDYEIVFKKEKRK
ncbi:MAG: hypothetical protein U9N34_08050, partial [Candidatus Cloacimonadota bacterium]|nr:hypothetical protein [Candidatus Cloacimonadota bacterium]